MFQQQPMRNQPGPQMPQRPGRALMPRHPGMRMQPPQAQQRGLQQMFQPMGAAQEQAGARGGGGIQGLLSKILPGSAASGGTGAGLGGTGSGLGGIQGLANPATISNMLGNVQKALGVAQQVTPMIQQYGPLVRNLPGMVKMFRQLNSDDTEVEDSEQQKGEPDNKTETSGEKKEEIKVSSKTPEKSKAEEIRKKRSRSAPPSAKRKTGGSKPKLYV